MTINHSVPQHSRPMQRTHAADCRQQRDGEGYLLNDPKPIIKSSWENSVVYGIKGGGKVKQSQCCDHTSIH